MSDDKSGATAPTVVTSEPLSTASRVSCWVLAVALLGSGGAATFFEKPGAAAAALIALGGLLTIIALMGRIPLKLEVGGATLDATYPTPDQAYDAGREGGLREGIQAAVKEVREAAETGRNASAQELVEQLSALEPPSIQLALWRDFGRDLLRSPQSLDGKGFKGPAACSAAGITYRQLDYWSRTGLVEPSGRPAKPGPERLYTVDDVLVLAAIRTMMDAGISLKQIRTLVNGVRARGGRLDGITVASDGESVYEVEDPSDLADLMGSGRAHFVVSFAGLRDDVRGALSLVPGEPLASD